MLVVKETGYYDMFNVVDLTETEVALLATHVVQALVVGSKTPGYQSNELQRGWQWT